MMLEEESAIEFAKKVAEEKLDSRLVEAGDIYVYGQNFLAERKFYLVENRKLYLVRSIPGNVERLPEFLNQGFIAIGWTETGDLTFARKDDIRMILRQHDFKGRSLGKNLSIVNDFVNSMREGDVVIVPERNKGLVHIGIVGDYQWREGYKATRMAHFREVK
jgi:predicted Mrr-cat superfamily restriction endonuclease